MEYAQRTAGVDFRFGLRLPEHLRGLGLTYMNGYLFTDLATSSSDYAKVYYLTGLQLKTQVLASGAISEADYMGFLNTLAGSIDPNFTFRTSTFGYFVAQKPAKVNN